MALIQGSEIVATADGPSDFIYVKDGCYRAVFKVPDGGAWSGTVSLETVDTENEIDWVPVTVCVSDLSKSVVVDRNCVFPITGPGFFRLFAAGLGDPVTMKITGSGNRNAVARLPR